MYVRDAATGEKFLPRIWESLEPDAGIEEVNAAEAGALKVLDEWSAQQLQGYEEEVHSKTTFRKQIQEDCQLLRDMMLDTTDGPDGSTNDGHAKTFGEVALGCDWNQPISCVWQDDHDGNDRCYIFATENWCYKIYMFTS